MARKHIDVPTVEELKDCAFRMFVEGLKGHPDWKTKWQYYSEEQLRKLQKGVEGQVAKRNFPRRPPEEFSHLSAEEWDELGSLDDLLATKQEWFPFFLRRLPRWTVERLATSKTLLRVYIALHFTDESENALAEKLGMAYETFRTERKKLCRRLGIECKQAYEARQQLRNRMLRPRGEIVEGRAKPPKK